MIQQTIFQAADPFWSLPRQIYRLTLSFRSSSDSDANSGFFVYSRTLPKPLRTTNTSTNVEAVEGKFRFDRPIGI